MEKVADVAVPDPALAARGSGSKGPRGRPRSEVSHEAILSAVLELLEKEGYQSVTIEGVARQAGVGKQTIYRWWRCRAEIVLEAYANHAASKVPVPDKGSVRSDLEAFLVSAFRRLSQVSGNLARGLMADAALDAEFAVILRDVFIARRREAFSEILRRGVTRGELRADTDLDGVTDLLTASMWYGLLIQQPKLDAAYARRLVALVLNGATCATP